MYYVEILSFFESISGFKALSDAEVIDALGLVNGYAAWVQTCPQTYPSVVVTPPSVSHLACSLVKTAGSAYHQICMGELPSSRKQILADSTSFRENECLT